MLKYVIILLCLDRISQSINYGSCLQYGALEFTILVCFVDVALTLAQVMDWRSGKSFLRRALDQKTLLRQVTNRVKFWGGNHTILAHALQKEKETEKLASRFAATKTEGISRLHM